MAAPSSFQHLSAWRKAMDLAVECYRLTATFPPPEAYGLAQQIRRAAASIPSNIAEGHNRRRPRVFASHLSIALGSQAELETQLELASRLGYLAPEEARTALQAAGEVGRILHGLQKSLRTPRQSPATST